MDTVRPAVRIRDLTVVRGDERVLQEVELDIAAGSVTGLLGPSGAGKTTLIRAIVGVQAHARGEIEVLGRPAGTASLRSRVAYVTQAPAVYDDLTIEENLRYFARVLGRPAQAVDPALDTVGLHDHADRRVSQLSGGQRSRVSLATALLGGPDLLVLDEPTVGLDPVLRAELWDTFHRLADDGVTLLISSHVMDEADRCERIVILREGRIAVDDTPEGMRQRSGCDRLEAAFLALVGGGTR